MRVLILCLVFCCSVCFAADEQNPSVLFYKGNMAYEQAKYDEAVVEYEKALLSGFESGNLYYNLSNAYFKKGELGRAILNYKRAERLMPQEVDLRANLNYAFSLIEQQTAVRTNLADLSMDGFAVFLAGLYLFIFLLAVILLFLKNKLDFLKGILKISCTLFIIVLAGFFIKIHQVSQPFAVILDKEAEVRYEPFDSATSYFKLFQGQQALLLRQKDSWAFIRRADGKTGWLKASSVEKI